MGSVDTPCNRRDAGYGTAGTHHVPVLLALLFDRLEERRYRDGAQMDSGPLEALEDVRVDERARDQAVLRRGRPRVHLAQVELLPLPIGLPALTAPSNLSNLVPTCNARSGWSVRE